MAEYGIIGDGYGTDLPEMTVAEQDLTTERNAAKFSRTAEFRRLKDHLEQRMEFYRSYMPDGTPVTSVPAAERGQQWAVANLVITEFRAVIAAYENASEVVKEATKRHGL